MNIMKPVESSDERDEAELEKSITQENNTGAAEGGLMDEKPNTKESRVATAAAVLLSSLAPARRAEGSGRSAQLVKDEMKENKTAMTAM